MLVDSTEYRHVIGSLQYFSLTQHDISFAINKLSKFMHRPTTTHWTATKRLLRYLKHTIFHGINFIRLQIQFKQLFLMLIGQGMLMAEHLLPLIFVFLAPTPFLRVSRNNGQSHALPLKQNIALLLMLHLKPYDFKHSFKNSVLYSRSHHYCCVRTHLGFNLVQHSRMKNIQIDVHFVQEPSST